MEAYLLDTSALTALVDSTHARHTATVAALGAIQDPIFISAISLAELMYGLALYEKSNRAKLPNAESILKAARTYPRLDVDNHTAEEYAELKSSLASHYLRSTTRKDRTRHVEDWIDRYTGKALGIDDNDLWICAQAIQVNFTLVANDKMNRIKQAAPSLKHFRV